MKRAILVLVGVGALAACLAAINVWRDPDTYYVDWRIIPQPSKEVNWELSARGQIVQTLTAPGVIEPVEEADIASQIVGRVVAVDVEKGDSVNKGDLLVKLDDIDARARLDSVLARLDVLQSAIKLAEADLEKADRDFTRSEELAHTGTLTKSDLDDSRTLVTKTQASLEMCKHEFTESEAMRRGIQQDLEYTEICAPIDGVVVDLDVEVGEVVIAGTINLPGTMLMRIADLDRMQVRASVDETDVLLVEAGQVAKIYLQADQRDPIPGSVDRIAPSGAPLGDVVSFETLIKIEGQHPSLRAGMTATVEIEVRRSDNALSVPAQAVVHRRRKDLPDTAVFREWAERHARSPGEKAREAESRYVKILFIEEGDVAVARPVETGLSDERRIEILSGIEPKDRVIVGPFRVLDELKDGQRVEQISTEEDES